MCAAQANSSGTGKRELFAEPRQAPAFRHGMPIDSAQQSELRRRLADLGFDDVRFSALSSSSVPLREWIGAGMHGDMQWMERTTDKRLDPDLVLPGARSMIMLGVSYWSDKLRDMDAVARLDSKPPASGTHTPIWARYALHEDYHDTMKPALVAAGRLLEELFGVTGTDYRYYVDTGPVLERNWAARAGIGFTGKNAMLISRQHGNWLLLASILTRIEFTPDAPITNRFKEREVGLLCGRCTRCLDACPTRAFAAPGVVDARRCISYQTIENKGVIPRELRSGIGNRIYGCDICLEVCPWNRFAQQGRQLLVSSRYDLAALSLAEILALTPERFAKIFRRTPIKRLKLVGLLRNACVVAGNVGDASLLPQLVPLASSHASPLVRAHAVWAVRRLGGEAQLADARAREADPVVLAEFE
jgi:epoxyqueuosine reductase